MRFIPSATSPHSLLPNHQPPLFPFWSITAALPDLLMLLLQLLNDWNEFLQMLNDVGLYVIVYKMKKIKIKNKIKNNEKEKCFDQSEFNMLFRLFVWKLYIFWAKNIIQSASEQPLFYPPSIQPHELTGRLLFRFDDNDGTNRRRRRRRRTNFNSKNMFSEIFSVFNYKWM